MASRSAARRPPATGWAVLHSYVSLIRLNRPIGIYLLLWPTLWALWVAANGRPEARLFLIFVLGVVITRSAGCIINDLADRKIDREVRRTRGRPLASGAISVAEALVLFAGLGCVAIALALMLNNLARIVAVVATVLLVLYPFTKRFLSVPQFVLGAAFASSIPMAFAATTGTLPPVCWLMFAITVIWAVIYDTLYAMVDRDDDIEAGVRSTAILFGDADRFVIAGLQVTMLLGLLMLGARVGLGAWYNASLIGVTACFIQQSVAIRNREREACFAAFLNNHYVGMLIFIGIALDYFFRPLA